jgi:hypothetical protein
MNNEKELQVVTTETTNKETGFKCMEIDMETNEVFAVFVIK